ncbi:photosynthetic reaction center subunit H [Pararhodospirillum oryzae]|uniref:Photosynthetic reaction center subunit H n=1 Tax=Pararhodospirillum oryzae TaxID=478448 RepID=A0A512H578_9PROT|nr:photosynthetic reaction center subunit H [Pararhodospirillum oryzae]GEO80520.1 photosynthetic reaction center subunit H [Pararhodospirillum oryzae]
MFVGQLVGNFDVATLVTAVFFVSFFLGLIVYLRMEDRREGYPLEDDLSGKLEAMGPHAMSPPKTFYMPHGGTRAVPNDARDTRVIKAKPTARWAGSPLEPTGDPMIDAVGPAAFTERAATPDLTLEGDARIVPLSKHKDFWLSSCDADPHGMQVVAADDVVVGSVADVWIDKSECLGRYFEVALKDGKRVLVPVTRALIVAATRTIYVGSADSAHFASAPTTARGDQITLREEDRIMGYFAGGMMYTKKAW